MLWLVACLLALRKREKERKRKREREREKIVFKKKEYLNKVEKK